MYNLTIMQRIKYGFCLFSNILSFTGVSQYGIADVSLLAAETHKFESRYCDYMIAPYNDETKALYDERSPIKHLDNINAALALFQGDEDQVKNGNI